MKFESIYSENFMSIGKGVEFKLNASPVTIIVGANGTGKSTGIIDALFYNLFGKPFRDDFSITDLVNDELKKGMLTISKFSSNGHQWEIKRGRKHDIEFEISKNGVPYTLPSDLKGHQKYLEDTILGFNAETFKQVVVLGSSTFVPFMKLKAPERRKVVEDLLAIRIFSYMNEVAKDDSKTIKGKIQTESNVMALAQQAVNMQEQKIASLDSQSKVNVESNKEQIAVNNKTIKSNNDEVGVNNIEIGKLNETIQDASILKTAYTERQNQITHNEREKNKAINGATFYKNHDSCSECKQVIDKDFKLGKLSEFKNDHTSAKEKIIELTKEQESSKVRLMEIKECMGKIQNIQMKNQQLTSSISSLQMTNQHLQSEIQRQSSGNELQKVQAHDDHKIANEKLATQKIKVDALLIDEAHNKAALELLKDSNMKGQVIKQYIPVVNHHIQKNLEILNFPATFKMDEKFNDTIVLNGKKRSYGQLSEGQKLRIDLSILFAWRTIASEKDSADSSLIVFDEIGSSSLDSDGMSVFQKLVDAHNKDANVVMISHDQRIASEYENVIRVKLGKGGFTEIENVKD